MGNTGITTIYGHKNWIYDVDCERIPTMVNCREERKNVYIGETNDGTRWVTIDGKQYLYRIYDTKYRETRFCACEENRDHRTNVYNDRNSNQFFNRYNIGVMFITGIGAIIGCGIIGSKKHTNTHTDIVYH